MANPWSDLLALLPAGLLALLTIAAIGWLAAYMLQAPRDQRGLGATALLLLLWAAGLVAADSFMGGALGGLEIGWLRCAIAALGPALAFPLVAALRQRDVALAVLASEAVVDPLTDLANHRGFTRQAAAALATAQRRAEPAAVLLLDLDRLGALNEAWGTEAGDAALRGAAGVLRDRLRAGDVPARLGGGTLGVLLPGAALADAAMLAERLRDAIGAELPHPGGAADRITASLGVAPVGFGEPEVALAVALAAADAALGRAKASGRNRVDVAVGQASEAANRAAE